MALATAYSLAAVLAFAASKIVVPLAAPLGGFAGALCVNALATWVARKWSVA